MASQDEIDKVIHTFYAIMEIHTDWLDEREPITDYFRNEMTYKYIPRCKSAGINHLHPDVWADIAHDLTWHVQDTGHRVPKDVDEACRKPGIEGAEARDHIRAFNAHYKNPAIFYDNLTTLGADILFTLTSAVPAFGRKSFDEVKAYGQSKTFVDLIDVVDVPKLVRRLMFPFFDKPFVDTPIFQNIREQLDHNQYNISGYLRRFHDPKNIIRPEDFKGSARECVDAYLQHTWLRQLFDLKIPFDLSAFKKHHQAMFARTRHGKTQTLQSLILDHLQEPDPPAMIVIDTESNLQADSGFLANLERLALFDDKMRDRLVVVDALAPDPPALNLFRLPALDRSLADEALELYGYIFRALDQTLTGPQETMFAYVARFMNLHHTPTLSAMLDLMNERSSNLAASEQFGATYDKLDERTRKYFDNTFFTNQFSKVTRQTISNRLDAMLANPTFERIFDAPTNTLDLYDAIENRKTVLIAPGGLGRRATTVLARYMIALSLRAAYQRNHIPEQDRQPALLFIDEAAGLFDEQINNILIRAGKYGLWLRFATQFVDQIPDEVRKSVMVNSEVFYAGGLTHDDARKFKDDMRTSADYLTDTHKLDNKATEFAVYIQNTTPSAIKLTFPFFTVENAPKSDPLTFQARKAAVRKQLAATPGIQIGDRVNVRIGDYDESKEDHIVADIKGDHVYFQDTETGVPLKDVRPSQPAEKAPAPSPLSDDPDDYKDSF